MIGWSGSCIKSGMAVDCRARAFSCLFLFVALLLLLFFESSLTSSFFFSADRASLHISQTYLQICNFIQLSPISEGEMGAG